MKPKLCTKPHTQENRRQRLCRKSELADRVFLNRYLAIPVFLMILGGIFYSTFEIADRFLTQPLAQLIHHLTDLLSLELAGSGIPFWIHELIIHGICAGVGSILSFLPTIATLFFFLSLLEHSGYMDRVARILDLPMNRIGLPGRAILPLVTGFGCSVPAILAAGMLPSRRDQRLTIAMIPFLSCSAKLPIYLILTHVFFPNYRVLAMLSIYLTGILLAICCALILSRTRFRTSLPPATWRMTPYQIPRMKTVLRDVLQNSLGFVHKAFTVILTASAVIWILQNFTPTLTMTSDSRESILACLGRFLSPLFAPLSRGFCARFSPRRPPAVFSYSACFMFPVSHLSPPSARPAANGGMLYIPLCSKLRWRGEWELWCIRWGGSLLECCEISCSAGDYQVRIFCPEKIPRILL